jgi:3-hydroxy-9,10-secoandrosta-1,3,5(10)-triene-9,17-dione monooxygenase reductase component
MPPSPQPLAETTRFDAKAFRRALGRFPTGVTVVTTRGPDGGFVGLTANSFNSVSLDPPLVLWSIGKQQTSLPAFRQAGVFAVNVLAANQIALSQRFASPIPDRFRDVPTFRAETGAPLLEGTSAWFDCALHHSYDGGDHLIFVGRVLACHAEARPALVYADGQYGVPSRHPMAPVRMAHAETDLAPEEFVADYLSYLLAKASALVSAEFHAQVRDDVV